jgi:SAM-dependent methyltransferase
MIEQLPPHSERRRREWEERYRAGRTGWDRGGPSPALRHWIDNGALAPCRVVVPGCGRGHEAVAMADLGFDVTAIDLAPTALASLDEQLRDRGLNARLVEADVLEWRPQQPFDAVYEQTSLCALEPAQWPCYADQLCAWLRPGGRLFASFMQTGQDGGPPFHCDIADMEELFPATRWAWSEDPPVNIPHSGELFELAYVLTRR